MSVGGEAAHTPLRAEAELSVAVGADGTVHEVTLGYTFIGRVILELLFLPVPTGDAPVGAEPDFPVTVFGEGTHMHVHQSLLAAVQPAVFRTGRVGQAGDAVACGYPDTSLPVDETVVDGV